MDLACAQTLQTAHVLSYWQANLDAARDFDAP